ncbi:MAG: protein translocase subunit SecD [Bryobacterales bacterium]|nr:protein translocase subunit SecD [Bryobacterales bacterium]
MRRSLITRTLVVLGVTGFSIYMLIGLPASRQELLANWRRNIRLGADLRGGMHVAVQVAWSEAWDGSGPPSPSFRDRIMVETRDVMLRKVNALGLSEATVQPVGRKGAEDQLRLEVPGVDDPARLKRVISTAGVLEWLDVQDGPFSAPEQAHPRNGALPLSFRVLQAPDGTWYRLARIPVIRGADLREARAAQTSRGCATTFVLSQTAAKQFEAYTASHIGRRAAIALDGKIVSVAVIEGKIGDTGEILGAHSCEEAAELALNLRAGSLPAKVSVIEEGTVGPSLGADSVRQGFTAATAGLGAVATAMVVYYKRSGVHAVLCLLLNAVILLAALSSFGAVLTLPGIAGLILTIGMAVDSNVLVFERIREELCSGKAAFAAVDAGFRRAFLTILDAHVTTIVACSCLFLFGTSSVQGFAITLVIGLVANVFTSVFVSRLLFDWELRKPGPHQLSI